MERLTKKHYGGNGYYMACSEHCNKECFDCKEIDKIIDRLGTYEDTGLEPENMAHWMDYFRAECEGRLVVLPCGTDVNLVRDGHTYKADHWNHTLTAFRDAPENKSGMQVALFSIKEAEEALKGGEG